MKKMLLFALLAMLVGCASTPRHVLQDETLRIGVSPDYPPIVFKTNGVISGAEADFAAYLATNLRVRLAFVELPFHELVPSLSRGDIDIIMSGMSDTDSRKDHVRFVAPYLNIGQMALVRKVDAPRFATSMHIYHVLRVGVLSGTTGEQFVENNVSNGTVTAFDDPADALVALAEKRVDAFIDDAPYVLQAAKEHPDLVALQWLLTDEHLAWALPKDEAYDDLYEKVNTLVRKARMNGDIREIVNRYFIIEARAK